MGKKSKLNGSAKLLTKKSKYTFRTFISELQKNTNLPSSFYAQFNRNEKKERARAAFSDSVTVNVENANARSGKKTRKPVVAKTNGDKIDVLQEISTSIAQIDMTSSDSFKVILSAYQMIDTLDSPLEVTLARKQLKQQLRLSKAEEKQFIEAARVYDGLSQIEIDLMERVTALYRKENDILYTIGNYYKYDNRQKLWRLITSDAVLAELQRIVRQLATTDGQISINNVCAESLKRLQSEANGEVLFRDLHISKAFKNGAIANLDTMNPATTDLFTNVENAYTASGDCHINLDDCLLRINTHALAKQIPKLDIYKEICSSEKTKFDIMQVLFNNVDRKINNLSGLYHTDYDRSGLYYRGKYRTKYLPEKKLIAAIKKGKAKNFLLFLDCISKQYVGRDRVAFLTAFLDMMAYLIQPIKRHNCFFYVYGRGENGKSFAIKMLEMIAGSEKVVFREIENANENPRFFASGLSESYAVVEDDLQHFKPELAGLLKKYSNGNSVVTTEIKHATELKTFLLKCSMVLLSNKRIAINDSTKGMSRRLYPFTMNTDISVRFDRDTNGVPLLNNELDYVFNLLRYRMPRVIKNGVQHNHLMTEDIQKITRGSTLDRLMNCLDHRKGKTTKLSDMLAFVAGQLSDIYGASSRQASRLTIEQIKDKANQLGFEVDDTNGTIIDAKLKKQ